MKSVIGSTVESWLSKFTEQEEKKATEYCALVLFLFKETFCVCVTECLAENQFVYPTLNSTLTLN